MKLRNVSRSFLMPSSFALFLVFHLTSCLFPLFPIPRHEPFRKQSLLPFVSAQFLHDSSSSSVLVDDWDSDSSNGGGRFTSFSRPMMSFFYSAAQRFMAPPPDEQGGTENSGEVTEVAEPANSEKLAIIPSVMRVVDSLRGETPTDEETKQQEGETTPTLPQRIWSIYQAAMPPPPDASERTSEDTGWASGADGFGNEEFTASARRLAVTETENATKQLEEEEEDASELPLPALPLKLSLGTWLPDFSLMNPETAESLPSLLYYVSMIFMQESLLFNKQELFLPPPTPSTPPEIETETLENVRIVSSKGFGNATNRYVFDLVEFKDKVYASTLNWIGREGLDLFFLGLPFMSNGGEIWEGTKTPSGDWNWDNVVQGGLGSSTNGGVRNMVVVGDYLYAITLNHFLGFELWRTRDGRNWTAQIRLGLGNRYNTSGRGLGTHKGYLYVGVENRATGAQLWRRKLSADGGWIEGHKWEVLAHGSGKGSILTNFWFSDVVEFQGNLYVGTMNFLGLEIWKITDEDPENDDVVFERVFKGDRKVHGLGVSKMLVWRDRLVVGMMFREPIGARLLSSTDGKNFNVHLPPTEFAGYEPKQFIYLWSLVVYGDRLYIAANEWTKVKQGFVLYSLGDIPEDPSDWTVESTSAFGYAPIYYGVRSMLEYEGELLMGSAGIQECVVFSARQKLS